MTWRAEQYRTPGRGHVDTGGWAVTDGEDLYVSGLDEETARLFAASRDMRDTLQNIMNGISTGEIHCDLDEVWGNATSRARAALDKASMP